MKTLSLVIFSLCYTCAFSTSQQTPVFNKYWVEYNNNNSIFFNEHTLGINLKGLDLCETMTENTFKEHIQNTVPCIGKWCIKDMFECNGTYACYHVDRIVDSEYTATNMVMLYGLWKKQLQENPYEHMIKEKDIVYGRELVDMVHEQIRVCKEQYEDSKIHTFGMIFCLGLCVIGMLILICYTIKRSLRKTSVCESEYSIMENDNIEIVEINEERYITLEM
jgi:hypothetical protein